VAVETISESAATRLDAVTASYSHFVAATTLLVHAAMSNGAGIEERKKEKENAETFSEWLLAATKIKYTILEHRRLGLIFDRYLLLL
jgi:hypothetical protein